MTEHIEVHLRQASVRVEALDGTLLGTGILLPWGDTEAVLTCAHLVPPEREAGLKVSFAGERRGVSEVWLPPGVDEPATAPYRDDMSLLTLEAPLPGASPIPWTSKVPEAGATVWFHGFRAGQSNTETIRTRMSAWNDEHGCFILQDAPARGTSGGPVCVEEGTTLQLVGMVVARVVDTASRGVVLPAGRIRDRLPAEHPMALVPELAPVDGPAKVRQRLLAQPGFSREFRIDRTLGHSDYATVFLARDLDLDREVAIKVLDPEVPQGEREAFIRDVRTAARFDHPNIIRILDATLREPLPFFVMEFVDGLPLRSLLEGPEAGFRVQQLADIVRQVGDALVYMHRQGFVHGNVSDGNVILDRSRAGRARAVISAFGVTPAGDVTGPLTPQARRDALNDQFFLGRIAHKLFPYAYPDGAYPARLAEVVMRMLHLDAAQRFDSVQEAIEAFDQALDDQDVAPRPLFTSSGGTLPPQPAPADADRPSPEVVERARTAYERWRRLPRFFESFYETLFAKDPSIADRFTPGSRVQQPEKLRRALDLVLKFPGQARGEQPLLAEIAKSHSFHGKHQIQPHLYPVFESALLETASRRDEAFDDRERQAWRTVLGYTFDFMQAQYY